MIYLGVMVTMWECINCSEVHEDDFDMCWRCGTTRGGEQPINFLEPDFQEDSADGAAEDEDLESSVSELIFSTTSDLKTHTINKYLGVVSGEVVLGANAINDFVAGITDIVGGRSETYESYLQQGRKIALKEAAIQAIRMGADAIIGIAFDYETIRGSMLMVSCTGTAVVAEENK